MKTISKFISSTSALFGMITLSYSAPVFPILIKNESGIDDDHTFLLIKAEKLDASGKTTGENCYMNFKSDGYATCDTSSTLFNSFDATVRLSSLPQNSQGLREVFLPQSASGRMYFSYKYPMDLMLDQKTNKIVDADGFMPKDSNYYTLYDKVEYTFNNLGTWMNPTAVDFFSLPIRITQSGSAHYQTTGLGYSRGVIFDDLIQIVNNDNPNTSSEWNKLFLSFISDNNDKTILRFISPGKAMINSILDTDPFDENFFTDTNKYGVNGQSYIDEIWSYYNNHTLTIDISEIPGAGPNTYCHGTTNPNQENYPFNFTCDKGLGSVSIPKQTSSRPFFSGAVGDFDAANNTPKAVIVRELSSATVVGLLPAPNGTILNRQYFSNNKDKYYLKGTNAAQHYDLYAKALHSFGNDHPIYTFAYDDALAQDGTLHDPTPNGENPSTAVITLGAVNQDVNNLPNVFEEDNNNYHIRVVIPNNQAGQPMLSITLNKKDGSHVVLTSNQNYVVKSPMEMDITNLINGMEYKRVNLYLNKALVRPMVKGAEGIIVNKNMGESIEIIFPAELPNDAEKVSGENQGEVKTQLPQGEHSNESNDSTDNNTNLNDNSTNNQNNDSESNTTDNTENSQTDNTQNNSNNDQTQSQANITLLDNDKALVEYNYTGNGDFVVVHVNVNGVDKGGYHMVSDGEKFTFVIEGLNPGDVVKTHFTTIEEAAAIPLNYTHASSSSDSGNNSTVNVGNNQQSSNSQQSSITPLDDQSIKINYQHDDWADVHVYVNGQHKGSYRMSSDGSGNLSHTVTGLNPNDQVETHFTTMHQARANPMSYTHQGGNTSNTDSNNNSSGSTNTNNNSSAVTASSSIAKTNQNTAVIYYEHQGPFAVAHINVNGQNIGGYNMTPSGNGLYQHSVNNLNPGDQVNVYFTNHQVPRDAEINYTH
ncbi:beta-1,3-glucanase family protein [Thiotrichales bacterium 19S9-12]|nr:beta-1,3-glucanase family protein [Thiotrichales bacterium 19S9-11]MCF6811052.1 beta-1,3-glucanase family protein [Thiotrichales bacterium 19S9-12]